ncbi:amino acid adenylation domain-containing protein [Pseudomonas kairouanensis]|uniref:Amino acid adenylation domain-containing protein n=1 Tax=Pseudomonas kairouanensis TaxID=2293832 RepID=A0A4Z0ARN9_9PSED|nr:non-ribosomal peptide synthetase [Pseudomonas kairouanensis]TFY88819.1 amino acid adenylation domain-containing protein [Pseudomonas kairouanensis]
MNTQDSLRLARRFIELPAQKRSLFLKALESENVDFSLFPIASDVQVAGRDALSYAQQRMWFAWQLDPRGSAYHLPMAVKLQGALDADALQRAVDALVMRHESLRTVFREQDDQVVQHVVDASQVNVEYMDFSAGQGDEGSARIDSLVRVEALAPFDLVRGPLLRIKLLKKHHEEHLLLVTLHHIVADGWSMGVLIDELVRLYDAACMGDETQLPALPIQYRDYALWQRSWLEAGEQARQLAYWLDKLGDEHPVLELPADFPRPAKPGYRGERYAVDIEPQLVAQLRDVARQHNVTLFMLLLASFSLLLYRYTGQPIQRVGVPIANRHRPETEGLIGCFINTQVLHTAIDPMIDTAELLRRVKASALEAQSFQDLPFEKLVEVLNLDRSSAHSPLFQVLFNHQSNVTDVETIKTRSGLVLEKLALPKTTARFDLALDTVESEGQLQAAFTFAVELFAPSTIARLAQHWVGVLKGLVQDTALPIGEICLGEAVSQRPAAPLLAPLPGVHELIAQCAGQCPERLAVVHEGQSLSYAQLNCQASQLQQQLQAAGVMPEQAVGVVADRSPGMVVGMLAVLKCGAAYVPLEPDQPEQRLAFMLEDAAITHVLTPFDWAHALPAGVQAIAFDRIAPDAPQALATRVAPGNLAYIIYTSGTTGTPKGVAVSHGALVNYIQGVSQRLPMADIHHLAMTSTPAADLGHTVFYGALCNGKCVHLLSKERVLDADALAAYMGEHAIDALKIVPSHLDAMLSASASAAVLPRHCLILGGEACSETLLARIAGYAPQLAVINHYGPTESTVGVLTAPLVVGQPPHLGTPLANVQVAVLDASLLPVPGGAKGELHIAGAGLARGYVGQPGLTAQRFVPDPHGPAGARMYRTGDFVRRDSTGALRFVGRMDHQVKIRGYRVEPGEVEQHLQGLPGVRQALVRVTGASDTPQLVAYVVASQALPDEAAAKATRLALQQALRGFMPEHMIPGQILFLDEVPLTANGKVDSSRLPVAGCASDEPQYVAPVTQQQKLLAQVWQEVLGVERVGLGDNFFALGGHSLLATQIVSRARRQLGLDIPLRLLFDSADLGTFCAAVTGQAGVEDAPIRPLDRQQLLAVSHAQHRQWLFWKIHPQSAAYNTPMAVRIKGALNTVALQAAFDALVARHESLRTVFVDAQGVPCLKVLPSIQVPLVKAFIGALHGPALERRLQEETQQPFDLANGPLLRLNLLQVSPEEHLLLLNLHHIVSDGWSMSVMVRECIASYNAEVTGQSAPMLAPLTVQYADYATWQRERLEEGQLHTQLGYWKTQLEDDFSVLQLPADRVRPQIQSYRGGRIDVRLPAELASALRRLAVDANATLFHIFLASFGLLLARYSASEKINIGVPVTNRNRLELEGLIGFFVNTLVVRVGVDFAATFDQLLASVKETSLQAQANKDIPFDVLVEELGPERGLGHNPLFQVMYNHMRDLGEQVTGQSLAGVTAEEIDLVEGTAQFDLSLDTVERSDGVLATFVYASDLFDHARIEQMTAHWLNLLQALVAQPHTSVDRLPLFSPQDQMRLEQDWCQGPATVHMADTAVARLFEARAQAQPHAPALLMGDTRLSYDELNRQANRLAHKLRELGVGPEVLVGVAVERSLDMVVGLLAILKTGGAYVPLDPDYPRERLAYMMQDSAIVLLLTQTSLQAQLPIPEGLPSLCLDQPGDWLAGYATHNLSTVIDPQSLAYVMYTSGSTGRPKGVGINQGSLSLHAQVSLDFFNLSASDRILQFATFNFDGFVEQLYPALICGASVVIRGPALWDSETFYRELIDKDISVVDLTTAYWFMLAKDFAAQGPRDYGRLHQLHAGGEAMPPEGVVAWKQAGLGHVRLLNTYGPTEATVTVTAHDCTAFAVADSAPPPALMPIGKALGGRAIYLLDNSAGLTVPGAIGELQIGGGLLARGYHNRPALTAERFIPDPFSQHGGRLYRTGDLARYVDDGVIEYVGRIDHQVKIRGFRIELGEISARLLEHPLLADALVIDIDGVLGKQLVGYLVPADPAILQADTEVQNAQLGHIRDDLRNSLPDYMVPAYLMWMAGLPLTPNGKLDRKALPAPDTRQMQALYVAPHTDLERQLCEIWATVLRIDQVGMQDNFFELGGHSLLAAQAISRINTQLGIDMPIRQLFETPVLSEFSQALESAGRSLTDEGLSDIERLMNEMTEA